jgi:aspartate kinase
MNSSPVLVQKFGGTSVSTPERRQQVGAHVRSARERGFAVAIVVSAMGRRGEPYATDTLLDLLRAGGGQISPADYTLMFVTGEIISAALMSHSLKLAGVPAVGMTGAQAGIFTDGHPTEAEIVGIETARLQRHLQRGEVPVVTGGQGIARESFDYSTLGRGASDTSGVAIGVALGAQRVEIFTDVEGVASADPRIVENARIIPRISFSRMHEFARFGAKVIHSRAVSAGWNAHTPVVIRSTFSSAPGTWIEDVAEEPSFSGIAALSGLETISLPVRTIDPGTLEMWERRRLIMHLGDVETSQCVLGCADQDELERAVAETTASAERLGRLTWISVIGEDRFVGEHATEDAHALTSAGIRAVARGTGPFRTTYLVDPAATAAAIRALHRAYAG